MRVIISWARSKAGRNQFAKRRNSTLGRLVAGLGSFGPAGISANVAAGCAVDQWQDLILDRFDPAGRLRPLGPVPLDEIDAVVTVVVGATQMDRGGEVGEAQLFPTCNR